MTVDIPSAISAVLATTLIGVMLAMVNQYFDYKSFKMTASKRLDDIDKHLEFGDMRYEDVKTLLTQIKANQENHEKRDEEIFDSIIKSLEKFNTNFENIWKGKQ